VEWRFSFSREKSLGRRQSAWKKGRGEQDVVEIGGISITDVTTRGQ
jgi:hypothetical protein